MLNLYVAPRSRRAPVPEATALDAALDFLKQQEIIGESGTPDEYPPGCNAANLFASDASDHLLPAEITFDALYVRRATRPVFLPEEQQVDGFRGATCTVCGDPVDPPALTEALDRLMVFPVERFVYACPSCRSELGLKEIDFGQPTAVARFWFLIEGAAFGRLTPAIVERLERLLDTPLVIVPERPDELVEDWVPARRGFRRRS